MKKILLLLWLLCGSAYAQLISPGVGGSSSSSGTSTGGVADYATSSGVATQALTAGWIDPVTYGASTNNLDNSAAFQAALNAAKAGPLKTVRPSAGSYYFTNNVRLSKSYGVTYSGDAGVTLYRTNWTADSLETLGTATVGNMFAFDNNTNLIVTRFNFRSYGQTQAGVLSNEMCAISLNNVNGSTNYNVQITKCNFYNIQGFAIVGTDPTIVGLVDSCYFENIGWTNSYPLIDGTPISTVGDHWIHSKNTGVNLLSYFDEYYNPNSYLTNFGPTIIDNIIIDCVRGIGGTSGGGVPMRIGMDISGNRFYYGTTHGLNIEGGNQAIQVAGARGATVKGNVIYGLTNAPLWAINIGQNYDGISIEGNEIYEKWAGFTNDGAAFVKFDDNKVVQEGVASFYGTNCLVDGQLPGAVVITNGSIAFSLSNGGTITIPKGAQGSAVAGRLNAYGIFNLGTPSSSNGGDTNFSASAVSSTYLFGNAGNFTNISGSVIGDIFVMVNTQVTGIVYYYASTVGRKIDAFTNNTPIFPKSTLTLYQHGLGNNHAVTLGRSFWSSAPLSNVAMTVGSTIYTNPWDLLVKCRAIIANSPTLTAQSSVVISNLDTGSVNFNGMQGGIADIITNYVELSAAPGERISLNGVNVTCPNMTIHPGP